MRRDRGPGGTRRLRQQAPPVAPGPSAARRRRLVLATTAVGLAVVAALALALVLGVGSRRPPAVGGQDAADGARPAPFPDAGVVVESADLDAGAEAVARVTIVVQPIPESARVTLGGRPVGVGRVQIQLQRSRRPVTLEVSARGHRSARQSLVPDRDRTVKVRLKRVGVIPPEELDDNPYRAKRGR
jgi:hypothetical protein